MNDKEPIDIFRDKLSKEPLFPDQPVGLTNPEVMVVDEDITEEEIITLYTFVEEIDADRETKKIFRNRLYGALGRAGIR